MSHNLDSKEKIQSIDPSGMYDKIYNFPEQLEQAVEIGQSINPDYQDFKDIQNIVVIGMGGSAIGGDLARSFLADRIKIPFQVCRNYNLPNFVDESTLVIASSYSGNTEETLSAFEQAVERKAKIVCLTTGGKLGELAKENKFLKVNLPTGFQPRAALGFSFVPLLFLLNRIFLGDPDIESNLIINIASLKEYRKVYAIETPSEKNPAKDLALKIHNKIPIIYTGPEWTDSIGTRWKGQICENAKCLAFNNQFPEFNHNELVGWGIIESYRDKLIVIYLKDMFDHNQISRRMAIIKDMIEKHDIEVIEIQSKGTDLFPLARMLSLIQIGDFVSYYLAILNNTDPTPVKAIDYLKDQLG